MGVIRPQQARAFYDRLGARQDWQAFYENPAIDSVVAHGRFDRAVAVCEFGCGTGRLAERLLAGPLPESATYLGLDISETMVRLAQRRLAPWVDRAKAVQTDGAPKISASDGSFDRFVAVYVLDLLSETDIRVLLDEARRVLRPTGLLCLVSLTYGKGPLSIVVTSLWRTLHALRPTLLGGCRPLELRHYLGGTNWTLKHQAVVCNFGIASEVVVAACYE